MVFTCSFDLAVMQNRFTFALPSGSRGRVARQRSAKPRTAVRIRSRPPEPGRNAGFCFYGGMQHRLAALPDIAQKTITLACSKSWYMKKPKVPGFFFFRIYLFSALIYFLLVLPFLLTQYIKNIDKFSEAGKKEETRDTVYATRQDGIVFSLSTPAKKPSADTTLTAREGEPPATQTTADSDVDPLGLQAEAFLYSFILGFLFSLPFKRYFRKRRKGRPVSEKLATFCKKYLLYSPLVFSGILFLAQVIAHAYLIYRIHYSAAGAIDPKYDFYSQFFYVSLVASLLIVTFVYYWQKHRVHIRYIEVVMGRDELRSRSFRGRAGRIGNRLWIASGMTTLLPLLVVLIYLFQSITHISDLPVELKDMSQQQRDILFGNVFFTEKISIGDDDLQSFFYVNAINSWFMIIGIYSGIFVALLYIFFFVKWTTEDIVMPVKELLANMKRTGESSQTHFTVVRTNDEIGELAEGYNEMSQRIHNYISNINRMNEAYYRFVPRQFLDMLGKKDITEITLGDQVEQEMSVLFTDIRDFTSLSETMTLRENFDFINSYLGLMEPIISRHNGFIDKYMGDSIMALFHGKVEHALDAAIEMAQTMKDFNLIRTEEGKPAIRMGIGIHTGNLMLGVVGGHGKMEGTVISDAVNLASRLEGLTKMYGSSIIVSQETLIRAEDPMTYSHRYLDAVKVKGKRESVYIFELLDGEPEPARSRKTAKRRQFARAIRLYGQREFDEALRLFSELHAFDPDDPTTEIYIGRCKKRIESGITDDWDGIEVIQTK